MSNPNDPEYWPRYAVFDHALKLHKKAAEEFGLEKIPTNEWTIEQVLQVALASLKWETWNQNGGEP